MTSLGGTHHSFLTVSDMDKNIMCAKKERKCDQYQEKSYRTDDYR